MISKWSKLREKGVIFDVLCDEVMRGMSGNGVRAYSISFERQILDFGQLVIQMPHTNGLIRSHLLYEGENNCNNREQPMN